MKIFSTLFIFLFVNTLDALAAPSNSYLSRPDITEVASKSHRMNDGWENLRDAHFYFTALILELHRDKDLYFLARDSELLYDAAKLMTDKNEQEKIHLLNVSRSNMRDPHLKEYLQQHGISEESLKNGQEVMFIDTGFAGTIPGAIKEIFPEKLQGNLKTHLIVSANMSFPSGRSFLVHINPAVNSINVENMHSTVVSYEHMPRYNERSNAFKKIAGVWHPITTSGYVAKDGAVSKHKALAYMEDLKAIWESKGFAQKINFFRATVRTLLQDLESSSSPKQKTAVLQKFLEEPIEISEDIKEALVRDIIDANQRLYGDSSIKVSKLGLTEISDEGDGKKNKLIKKFPQWKPILEDPDVQIPKLFAKKRYDIIGALIDADVDAEINSIISKLLFDDAPTGPKKTLQLNWIKKVSDAALSNFANELSEFPYANKMPDQIEAILERDVTNATARIFKSVFKRKDIPDLEKLVLFGVEKSSECFGCGVVFMNHDGPEMDDAFLAFAKKFDKDALQYLVRTAVERKMTSKNIETLEIIVKKRGAQGLTDVAYPLELRLKNGASATGLENLMDRIIKSTAVPAFRKEFFKTYVASQKLQKCHTQLNKLVTTH